jgi:hypothetical protein
MATDASRRSIDRSAFRVLDWDDHVAVHDQTLRDYWLGQPIAARLAGAMHCRRRVHGQLPPVDRTCFRLVDLAELGDR